MTVELEYLSLNPEINNIDYNWGSLKFNYLFCLKSLFMIRSDFDHDLQELDRKISSRIFNSILTSDQTVRESNKSQINSLLQPALVKNKNY